ncbi:MAG: hypothetical protein GTN36_03230 [Candidatus Aenigmarchaeota archaeon]|nr:hypothetical protein [Candidatus Aenigmarchaeota archaeon]
MKGIDTLMAAVFIILISVAGIAIVLETSQPSVGRLEEISLMKESKNILTKIDDAVKDVAQQGEGSTRVLTFSVGGGEYFIDAEKEALIFFMTSRSQIIGVGISTTEGNINMFGEPNRVLLNISYSKINVTEGGRFGKGYRNLFIRNNGYDFANQKQIISISLVPVLPPTALAVQFNQDDSPYIVSGTNVGGIPLDLNNLGEGSTYDVEEEGFGVGGEKTDTLDEYGTFNTSTQLNGWNENEVDIDGDLMDNSPDTSVYRIGGGSLIGLTFVGRNKDWSGEYVYRNTTLINSGLTVQLNLSWRKSYSSITPTRYDMYVRIMHPNGTVFTVWSDSSATWNTWKDVFQDVSSYFDASGEYEIRLECDLRNGNDKNAQTMCWFDEVFLEVSTPFTYRIEILHNSTPISYSGTLYSINATLNFTTNVFDTYSLQIYDWQNSQWKSTGCGSGDVQPDIPTQLWCNENIDPLNYNSSDNIVRIRIKSTTDSDQGILKEDYVQYYVNYIP